MTHDELLAKIDHHMLGIVQTGFNDYKAHKALRAIVELHKPKDFGRFSEECIECGYLRQYPCPTSQAIEKALQ